MGAGIGETLAATGTEVFLIDKNTEMAERGIKRISENMDKEIGRWGLTASEKKSILSRIHPVADLSPVKDAEMVIETIPDRLDMKQELFAELDTLCPPETVLVTNTSTLSISEIASMTKRPDKVIGLHFLNPVNRIPIVEVVR
ncbi:MAG: 3-hydroxyacyl-CoA dehydrogenase NAD-binding domain-containing protein, partial [candidate division Zixibacteria bacterium]|nr:3-hydroxyacyl-CoA dehydrogenase NAD-binding domain-containing protein [candidate division Zixibacteria bacterium]